MSLYASRSIYCCEVLAATSVTPIIPESNLHRRLPGKIATVNHGRRISVARDPFVRGYPTGLTPISGGCSSEELQHPTRHAFVRDTTPGPMALFEVVAHFNSQHWRGYAVSRALANLILAYNSLKSTPSLQGTRILVPCFAHLKLRLVS